MERMVNEVAKKGMPRQIRFIIGNEAS